LVDRVGNDIFGSQQHNTSGGNGVAGFDMMLLLNAHFSCTESTASNISGAFGVREISTHCFNVQRRNAVAVSSFSTKMP